jgi:hypothetical protein
VFVRTESRQRLCKHNFGKSAQVVHVLIGLIGQVQPPGASVAGVVAAFDQPGLFQAIDHAPGGDRLDFQPAGDRALVDPGGAADCGEHAPLRARHAQFARAHIEPLAKQASDIVRQKGHIVRHALAIIAMLIIVKLHACTCPKASDTQGLDQPGQ